MNASHKSSIEARFVGLKAMKILPCANQLLLTYTPPSRRIYVKHHEPPVSSEICRITMARPKRVKRFHEVMRIEMAFVQKDGSAHSWQAFADYDCAEISIQEAAGVAIDFLVDRWLDDVMADLDAELVARFGTERAL